MDWAPVAVRLELGYLKNLAPDKSNHIALYP